MDKEQALQFAKSGAWKEWNHFQRALFQLKEPLLCMPFTVFHEAVEKSLGRPTFTHEFVNPKALLEELLGERPEPTLQEIMDMIPKDKQIIIVTGEDGEDG